MISFLSSSRRDEHLAHLALLGKLAADHCQVVVERLHVGADLGLDVAGQIADILVGERHDRPGEHDLAIAGSLLQGCCQGQQGLAGARLAGNRDQRDLWVAEGVDGEALFGVAGH